MIAMEEREEVQQKGSGRPGPGGQAHHRGASPRASYQPWQRCRIVQSLADYDKAEEEREFMRAVVEGLADLEGGRRSHSKKPGFNLD